MCKRSSFPRRSETRPFFPLSISIAKLAPCWSCKRGQIRAKSCKILMEHTHTVLNDMRDQVLHVFVRFLNPQYTNTCMFIQTKNIPKAVLQMRFFAHLNLTKHVPKKHMQTRGIGPAKPTDQEWSLQNPIGIVDQNIL